MKSGFELGGVCTRAQTTSRPGKKTRSSRAQGGYLMISMMLVLFVTGALLTLYAEKQSERSRLERGEQIGLALSVLGAGLDAYIESNYAALAADVPTVAQVGDALRPTAEELIRLISIKGVAAVPPFSEGASYQFRISYPAGCTQARKMSDLACRPAGLAYIDKPVMRKGAIDYVGLARAVRVMKGRGGYSHAEDPSRFTFLDSASSQVPLPIVNPTNLPGVLAWRASTLHEDDERLKVNGGNRMNATLRLDGKNGPHDLVGAGNITASGKVSSRSLDVAGDASIRGNTSVAGNISARGNTLVEGNSVVNGNHLVKGWLKVLGSGLRTTDVEASGTATFEKNATVGDSLTVTNGIVASDITFNTVHAAGQRCARPRRQLAMDGNGDLLYCDDTSRWANKK